MERERTFSLPVSYEGVPLDIAFPAELPTTVRVRIHDTGRRLFLWQMSSVDSLTFNLQDQLTAPQGEVLITAEQLRRTVDNLLPPTAQLTGIQPEHIRAAYIRQSERTFQLTYDGHISPATQYAPTGHLRIEPQQITVYGSKEQLDTLQQLYLNFADFSNLRDSATQTATLRPISGLRYSATTVSVTAYAQQYTERSLVLPISVVGAPHGTTVRLFPSEATVRFNIPMRYFSQLQTDNVQLYVDYREHSASQKTLQLHATYPADTISHLRMQPAEVEYIIETN